MRTVALISVFLVAAAAWAGEPPVDYTLDHGASSVTYELVHKLHKFEAVSRRLDGKARIVNGVAQVVVRTPVETFDSGNANRDAHMKETVDAARWPTVEAKALAAIEPPASFPQAVQRTFSVQLSLHGVQQIVELPLEVVFESPTRVRARGTAVVSVDGFKIERPSLMFVKIDDEMRVTVDVVFNRN